ncbi:MAG: CusA/CzcA family heavy metal efflux RND transporter, partial [Phaeodactylibacter sp.]|nr:CusA/CzcA family heavy metal efflux RND transporter [Phaeodactylibacter sp.]
FGLSVVTVVFDDATPVLDSRQYVKEQISMAEQEIPPGMGKPELMPITTGLGEIYQYVLRVKPGYEHQYGPMELRTIQDWIVKRQLSGIKGIIEVSSFGGYLKQYEVALDPLLLQSYDVSVAEVFDALSRNNQNSGGSYIEKNTNAYYIRTEGIVQSIDDIAHIVVGNRNGAPILIQDIGKVQLGSPKRFGAMTMDGQGEAVGGITLMFKGGNASDAIANVHRRAEQVEKSLPEGITLYAYLDRSELVGKTISTVKHNLLEGGLIVVLVLTLLLGDLRAGFIVASVIPLAMLFALILMNYFGISANLMSLGAIDFGIVVDGAVIIVEGVLHVIFTYYVGKQLSQQQMDTIIIDESAKMFRAAVFGVFIILMVFIPIMTLTGIEGKMFRPMAMAFSFAILGALILSLTYVPMMAAWAMPKRIREHQTFADRLVGLLRRMYKPSLEVALKRPALVIGLTVLVLVGAVFVYRSLGAEFIPTLEEGDLAMQMTIQPGSSLQESIKTSTKAERILLENFPEVRHVVSKIGTAEVPTDPMAIEDADIMIILKPKEEWVSASSRDELASKMKEKLEVLASASFEFTQPIQLRFNELLTGAKTDIAIKIFGEDMEMLKQLADQAAGLIQGIPGAGDVKVEQTEGLPQLRVHFNRAKIAEYGLDIDRLNSLVRTAYAGEPAGVVFENERKFDLVVRLQEGYRQNLNLSQLYVHLDNGRSMPLSEVAEVEYSEGPMQISREDTRRRINIGVNVRERDVASLVADIELALEKGLSLPPGYYIRYGGQFENLEAARKRLGVAVPVALAMIFVLLYFTFGKLKYALMIFTAVPIAAVGGVLALWSRGMPFSISAGVGFIALFGVAVLNGIVLISHFNRLRYEEGMTDILEVVVKGGLARMRPVIMTATVAALGFLPMALSTSNGAEVQKPLATVVIGGLVTATLLTLIVLPVLYYLTNRKLQRPSATEPLMTVAILLLAGIGLHAQQPALTLDQAVQHAMDNHPSLQNGAIDIRQASLGIDAARVLPPAEVLLGVGQYNSSQADYQLTATQPLGRAGLNRQREAAARARLVLATDKLALLRHQSTYQIEQAWFHWLYRKQLLVTLAQQEALYHALADKAALSYRSGETGQLENALAQSRLGQAQQAVALARSEEELAFNRLQQAAFLDSANRPPDSLRILPLPIADTATSALLLAPLEQESVVARENALVMGRQLSPEFSVGYFNQSIRPVWALQAVQAGMAVPLFRKSQRAHIEQAKLEEAKAANELARQRQILEQERQLARQQALNWRQQLDSTGKVLLEQGERLKALAMAQLRSGEIDYFQYVQSVQAAFENEIQYIKLIEQSNQAVLYLQYLSK